MKKSAILERRQNVSNHLIKGKAETEIANELLEFLLITQGTTLHYHQGLLKSGFSDQDHWFCCIISEVHFHGFEF